MADYSKIGLLVIRGGKILLCRKKRGTQLLILPGGKLEKKETSLECLHREVEEELGDVTVSDVVFIGQYTDRAAKASGRIKTVDIELYGGVLSGEPMASSEIAELVWFSPDDDWQLLAPSLRNKILPDLQARRFI
jgi:8-oxo-dGTP diphosphatase